MNLTPVFQFNLISCSDSKEAQTIKPTVTGSWKLPCLLGCLWVEVASPWNVFCFPYFINSCSFLENQIIITPSVNIFTNPLFPPLLHHKGDSMLSLCSQSFLHFFLFYPVLTFWNLLDLPLAGKPEINKLYFHFLSSFLHHYHTEFSPLVPTSSHSRSTQRCRLWTCSLILVSHLVFGSLEAFWLNFTLKQILLCHSIFIIIFWSRLSFGL